MSLTRRDFFVRSAAAVAATSFGQLAILRALQQTQQPPAGAAPQQTPAPVTPVFTPIRRNVGFFTARGGTIGYLINKDAVVVIDTQFPDTAKMCLDGLQERSKNHGVDLVINTHHHGDHTQGNIAFKGVARHVLAHARAVELQKEVAARPVRAGGPPAPEQLYADRTFTDTWREQLGDEWISGKYYGRAHTAGDIALTFERANVVHMGDLMFNRRHPVVDLTGGVAMANHIKVLEAVAKDHNKDTMYIFGHSGNQPAPATGTFPVTGKVAELMYFRDYLTALLSFVQGQMKAGKSRDDVAAIRDPLKGFESHGPLTAAILGNTYDHLMAEK